MASLGIARINDMVSCVCCCHQTCISTVGYFITSSDNVISNQLGTVRIGDMAICDCGHPTFVVTGSDVVLVNSIGVGRITDTVSGCPVGTIITSSENILTG